MNICNRICVFICIYERHITKCVYMYTYVQACVRSVRVACVCMCAMHTYVYERLRHAAYNCMTDGGLRDCALCLSQRFRSAGSLPFYGSHKTHMTRGIEERGRRTGWTSVTFTRTMGIPMDILSFT